MIRAADSPSRLTHGSRVRAKGVPMHDRGSLRDVTGWSIFLAIFGLRSPITALILLAQTGSYLVLRLWQEGVIPGWIDWGAVWQRSLLSQQAIDDGRYYTLFTCYLFQTDLALLAFECLAIGFFFSIVERRLGAKITILVALLGCLAASGTFLIITNLSASPNLAPQVQWAIDHLRVNHAAYEAAGGVWRCVPLWVLPGFAAILASRSMRFWAVLGLAAAAFVELSWVTGRTGQHRAWDGYLLNALLGLTIGAAVALRSTRRVPRRTPVRPSIRHA